MEMKENLFLKLPTAPPTEDQGQGYRLQKINEIQAFLEQEVATREALTRKYSRAAEIVDRAAEIVDNVVTVLIAITLGGGVGGIGLLSTVITAPTVVAIEEVALFTGFLSIICKYSVKKCRSKAEKHDKIKTIASTKQNTIDSRISEVLSDNRLLMRSFD